MVHANGDIAILLAADSFRVRPNAEHGEPEVRGGKAHLNRFALTALAASQHDVRVAAALDRFLAESTAQIGDFGLGWPRLELWGFDDAAASTTASATASAPGAASESASGNVALEVAHTTASPEEFTRYELRLALRPLPELGASIGLRSAVANCVEHPERKGPNIARYAALNQHLEAEALLLDQHGYVLEGATTSLLWWQDELLCVAPPGQRVDSITESLLVHYAHSQGTHVMHVSALPSDLADAEVWAVNALHGIRPARRLDEKPLRAAREDRLREYTVALDRTWRPLR